jgi:hypothetical protein
LSFWLWYLWFWFPWKLRKKPNKTKVCQNMPRY